MKVQTLVVTEPQEQENPGDDNEGKSQAAVSIEDANITVSAAGDISNHPQEAPRWPGLQKYPTWLFGNQKRSFNKSWMDQYSWLEYSMAKNTAFCFACRHFLKQGHEFHLEPTFTSNRSNNWRKASASLKSARYGEQKIHESCDREPVLHSLPGDHTVRSQRG